MLNFGRPIYPNRFGVSSLVARLPPQVALALQNFFCPRPQRLLVEARGFEPLTSGLQSPRSAKLSYAPSKAERLVAGAGFEPATFGL
jgi:hypothetical protein